MEVKRTSLEVSLPREVFEQHIAPKLTEFGAGDLKSNVVIFGGRGK
jgi:hypothetical protein